MKNICLQEFENLDLRAKAFSTQEILRWSDLARETLQEELTAFFPKIFLSEKDWRYVVRHYFFDPLPRTRYALFVRSRDGELVGTSSFDIGPAVYAGVEKKAAYVHIRALLPEVQIRGLGQAMARWILSFEPDILFTTCMQPASLYSWVRLVTGGYSACYDIWPRLAEDEEVILLPPEVLGEAFSLFTQIYAGHVKGDAHRVEAVVRNLTVRFVRRAVGMEYGEDPWSFPRRDPMAQGLDLKESDGVLVVVRRKQGEAFRISRM